jgi:hypothetical protein
LFSLQVNADHFSIPNSACAADGTKNTAPRATTSNAIKRLVIGQISSVYALTEPPLRGALIVLPRQP